MRTQDHTHGVRGVAGLWRTNSRGLFVPAHFQRNQIQAKWGFIAAQAIGRRKPEYGISTIYIEFENVADPVDSVTIPAFDESEGVEYYGDLMSSGTRDFLRVPLLSDPLLSIDPDSAAYFTAGTDGNRLTLFAQSVGLTGVHGKTYSDSVNSKIFGAALVATPVPDDWTQDVVFARTYFSEDEQETKDASSQVGVSWQLSFLP